MLDKSLPDVSASLAPPAHVRKWFHLLPLTLSLPRSSIDDVVFSVFTSNFFKLSYKISLLKNRFVTLFFIRFS